MKATESPSSEPRCGLCRVARVLVVGEEADQAAAEPAVKRGEHERERGLRDARADGRKPVRERAELVAVGEDVGEREKGGWSMTNDGKRIPRGSV